MINGDRTDAVANDATQNQRAQKSLQINVIKLTILALALLEYGCYGHSVTTHSPMSALYVVVTENIVANFLESL